MKNNLLFSQTTALCKTLGKRLAMVLTMLLVVGIGQAWGETIVSWSGAGRTADTEYDPTTSQTDNSTAKLKSECTLSTAGTGGSAGSYYGAWTDEKCIYVTGLNLSNYKDISLTVYLRRRYTTCTASFYTSTDGSTYAATALTTKTLTNTLASYTVTGIQSNVKSIKILITGGSGNLWLGTLSFEGTKATATPIDVTLHYKGTSTTISNQTSPYTLPTTGDYVADACDGWEFAGWYGSEYAKSETEPTFLSQLTSSGDAYAVYSHTETTGGGTSTNTTTDNIFSNGTFANNIITWTLSNVVSIKQERNGSSNSAVADYTDAPRWYKGHKITITPSVDITKITVVAQSGYADELANATFTNATASYSSNTVTITPENGRDPITIVMGAQARLSTLTVTYSGGGNSSTTYYSTTPECNTEPTGYTITYNTNGGDVIAATSGTTLPDPLPTTTKTGYTFAGWYTDEGCTQAATAGAAITQNTTLYAKWTINRYTVKLYPNYPAGKTGTFTYDAGELVDGNLVLTYDYNTASMTIEDLYTSLTLDGYEFGGWYSANGVNPGEVSGSEWTTTGTITGNKTYYAKWSKLHTVTFNTGTNNPTIDAIKGTSETGITLPAGPTPACTDWTFAGWATASVTETTTEPTLLSQGNNYKPTEDRTLYAVYSYTEAGGVDSDVTFNFSDIATANSWTNGTAYTTVTISPITINAIGGGNNGKYYTSNTSWRMYNGGSLQISTDIGKITSVSSNPSKTFTINDEGTATLSFSATTEFKSITVSYSSTTYNSNPVCIPTYSITYDFAGGTGSHCSNTSVQQGNPYTICDEAPTKEGHTFLGWSDGINTYQPNNSFTPTSDITLTAQWQVNTYIVTWNNNGVTTPIEYNHGETLEVPATPASCDGVKEFVGWTTHSGYYHATTAPDDIFTTKTTPVSATATYYAVFATKGEGSANFVLGESGTFKMYANVEGTKYYAQGGVSSSKITSTTEAANASDYTLTYADGVYTIKQGTNAIGHSSKTDLSTTASSWTISAGANGSWRITSNKDDSRALSYSAEANVFKAYATSNLTAGNETYFDIEFGGTSSGYSDYTTTCQQIESIEVQNPQTEFYITDDFTIGSGKVIATLSGGGTTDVTALATFSGYNMNVVGTYTVTVTYMGATATYEINVKPLDNAWVLTWNVSGKTNTGLSPRSITKGNAIGKLPVPEVPAACAGKTFMGWTESNIVPSDGKGIVYITEETVPSKNTTYYAVFATINNFSTQAAIEDIESGSKVVIVAVASMDASGGAGQAISSRTISITSKGVIGLSGDEVSIFDETINTPHSTCIWTLTKEGGGIVFEQGEKYIRAVDDGYRKLLLETTKDYWTLSPVGGKDKTYHMQSGNTSHYVEWFDHTDSKYAEGERYIGFVPYLEANDNGDFDMQFYVTANDDGEADITDYTTGCAEYTITYYGFHGGYSTSCSSDGTIVLPVNSTHTIPNCEGLVINDHTNLGREFLNVWMTQPHGGHTFKPGDTFILTQDTTLYAQWKMETTSDVTTLPTDIEDLAGTDIYVYGGKTLNIQPGTTTINSLTLKGGIQEDGSYKMPTVWVPEGATLIRNSNKIYLDLAINAKNYYPFAVPFATKNNEYVEYLDPVLAAASTYGTHFAIKTYDGEHRAEVGEDKANNWVRVLRGETLQPGVGYIITALTYPDKDTATIRIPMTVPNTWFKNGEQAEVGTTVRNTIAVTAHAGEAATEHQRHAGWNFVANPYLSNFTGGGIDATNGLDYIDGELIIQGSYEYSEETVPYVTIPAYNFAYYSQYKLSDVKLSPEWSFFVQVGTGGTMNFTTAGRQQAPAHLAARAAEQPIKMDVDITLSDDNHSDQTGLIICDRFSDAYEIGHDLEKMFGSAYNLSVYTLMADNTPLAFQALAIQNSMQVIPVGYRTPAQGEYTFALNEATSDIELLNEQYEQLILVDYETGALTNMLNNEYTFYSDRTQSNNRFALYAVPRQNTTTDLPNTIGNEEVKKVIYNDHFYILRDGKVFNGAGQIVK